MIHQESPRKTRRPGSHKSPRATGSAFCIRLQTSHTRSPSSPVFSIHPLSDSSELVSIRTTVPTSSGSSVSSYHLRQQVQGIFKRPTKLSSRTEGKRLPDVPALVYDSSASNSSAESLLLPLSAAGVAHSVKVGMMGDLSRRQSIPEELLSPKVEEFTPVRPQLPPRSSSVPVPVPAVNRTRSFADRLEMRNQRDSDSDSQMETTETLRISPPSSASFRRGRPPPIMIPPPRHRKQSSEPLFNAPPRQESLAIDTSPESNPVPLPIQIPTLPPPLASMASLAVDRHSVASTNSTDSTKTITPAIISRATRVQSIQLHPQGHERASSLPLPNLLAGLRESCIAVGQSETMVNISGRGSSPRDEDSTSSSPTSPPQNLDMPAAGEQISPSSQSTHPPLSALTFPADAENFYRSSMGSTLTSEGHHNRRSSVPSSYDIGSLPFVVPSVPALPKLPALRTSMGFSGPSISGLKSLPSSPENPLPKPTSRPLDQLRQANTRRPSTSSIDRVLSVFVPEPPSPSLPFPWKTLPAVDAKRLIDPKALQEMVVNAVKGFANQKLVINDVHSIPKELDSALIKLMVTKNQLQAECDQREKLLLRHVACLHSLNGDEGSRFAQTLVNAIARSDRLARQQAKISDHIIKLSKLQDSHSRASASLCLSKLNTAFTRSREAEKTAKDAQAKAEAERDEALQRLKAMEEYFAGFADQQGTVSLQGVMQSPSSSETQRLSRSSSGSGSSTPKTAISFSLSDLRISTLKFPRPPNGRIVRGRAVRPCRLLSPSSIKSRPRARLSPSSSSSSPISNSSPIEPSPTSPASSVSFATDSSTVVEPPKTPKTPKSPYRFPRPAPSTPALADLQYSPTLPPTPSALAGYMSGGRRPSQILTDTLRHGMNALRNRPSTPTQEIPVTSSISSSLGNNETLVGAGKRMRSSSEPPVVVAFDAFDGGHHQQYGQLYEDYEDASSQETLEISFVKSREGTVGGHSRTASQKNNLASISLSEVDSMELADMLAGL